MPTLQQIRHFQAVLQHGTVHAAAQAVHATQPALTRSIHSLEERLGVKLFERSRQGMVPTAFAEQIAPRLQELLLQLEDVRREAALYRNVEFGTLTVGIGQALREPLSRRCVPPFVIKHPAVHLRVREGTADELMRALYERKIDLILAGALSYREFDAIRLEHIGAIPLNVIVRRGHPLADGRCVTIEALTRYPRAGTTFLGTDHPLRAEFGNRLDPQYVCSDHETLFSIVESTDAWTRAPTSLIDVKSRPTLIELEVNGFELKSELSIIELKHRARSPVAQHLIDEVRLQVLEPGSD